MTVAIADAIGTITAAETTHPAFGTVLLATDLTPVSDAATSQAIRLATELHARLLVVNVIDSGRTGLLRPLGRLRPVEERERRTVLASGVVAGARLAGAMASFLVWDGDPGEGILAAAEAEHADLIVVGTRGRASVGRLLGSVSDHVVRKAKVPVIVAYEDDARGGSQA